MSVWLSRKAVGESKKTAVHRLHSANQLMKDRCRCKKKWSIWVKHWMLVYLSRKAVRQSQKRMIQAANLGMNDTHAKDADIRPVNDEEPMAEVHLTVEYDVHANEQLHTKQSEPIYDTYVLEKVDSNTTPDSTNMSNNGGKTDQDAEQYHVKSLLPASLIKRQTTEQSCQSLKSENIFCLPSCCENDLSKPVTLQHWPKVRESAFAKTHHVIAPGLSRNSPEEAYGLNDMIHNYYQEEARKKTQERHRNFKPRKMPYARTHNTPNDCKPNPRRNNQTSRNWPTSKSSDVTLKSVKKAEHSRNSRS
ncbi:hypothetical protein Tco_1167895 [Tanacetum coccineum]